LNFPSAADVPSFISGVDSLLLPASISPFDNVLPTNQTSHHDDHTASNQTAIAPSPPTTSVGSLRHSVLSPAQSFKPTTFYATFSISSCISATL